jgi:hypothetical protein
MFNFRSKDSVDYLRLMMTSNEIYLNYEVVDLQFCAKYFSI